MQNPDWKMADDQDLILEIEIICQTLIVAQKMKQNGNSIVEAELDGRVAIS